MEGRRRGEGPVRVEKAVVAAHEGGRDALKEEARQEGIGEGLDELEVDGILAVEVARREGEGSEGGRAMKGWRGKGGRGERGGHTGRISWAS